MLSHPLTITGAIVAISGWAFLFFGVGARADFGPTVFNIHRGMIADNVILLGYVLALAGIIARVGEGIAGKVAGVGVSQIAQAEEAETATVPARTLTDGDRTAQAAALRASLDRGRKGLA